MKKALLTLALAVPLALTAAPLFALVTVSLGAAGTAVAAAAPTGAPPAETPKRIIIKRAPMGPPEGDVLIESGTCLPGDECPPRLTPGDRRLKREVRIAHPEAPFVPLVGILIPLAFFVCIALVIIVAVALAHQGRISRYRLIEKAISEGKDIPPQLLAEAHGRRDPIGGALVLIATGLGLSIALGLVAAPVQAVWGLIPLLIGLALLIAIPLRKRMHSNGD